MSDYAIVYTPLAIHDLEDILYYAAENLKAPDAAINLVNTLESGIAKLKQFPYRAPEAKDSFLAKQGYRTLFIKRYVIFYMVSEDKRMVHVHRIVYGRRNLAWVLGSADDIVD